ncbi:Dam family site-specific DNA-(adenine-N6)-methyltransferase [Chimaeribacter californicus]|uniref:Dam family site-specific DNA-(adenine-N6)-methyltransferase n=1 Tax=Chimaeribacter californicus TaxID=2060067 RepID=UPI001F4D55A7|nr:Dam family site-specific DNA-(adenine-N6)-methyltransferase [Chimaeribacter californicus]
MTLTAPLLDRGQEGLRTAVPAPDLLVGGTPCQAFSVAGLGNGLGDERGQLTLKYVELANAIDQQRAAAGQPPTIIVWENVAGVFSDKDNAFGCFLAGLAGEDDPIAPGERPEPGKSTAHWRWRKSTGDHVAKWALSGCVYGQQRRLAWRTLDAQYFGVAQRRRRVFVVATARHDLDPAEILFEFDGVRRDTAPSRDTRPPAGAGAASSAIEWDTAPSYSIAGNTIGRTGHNGGNQVGIDKPEVCHTLTSSDVHAVVSVRAVSMRGRDGGTIAELGGEVANCLSTGTGGSNKAHALVNSTVRRLMPHECEALQGFPHGHTMIPWRNKPAEDCQDAPRYKAIGNSMAVPVMRWIGERILKHLTTDDAVQNLPGETPVVISIESLMPGLIAGGEPAAAMPTRALSGEITLTAAPGNAEAIKEMLDAHKIRPFLKWAGGKYSVLDTLRTYLPPGKRLIEPFVGAGSVFMNTTYDAYLLGDINPYLINLYQQLATNPQLVVPVALALVTGCNSEAAYMAIRNEFNARTADPVRQAALFLALNRTCFNGLCRFNQKGLFNVGWNKNPDSYFPLDELCHFAISDAAREFVCAPFQEVIAQASEGDVIFCDPPYEPLPDERNFTAYSKEGFTFDDQVALVEHLMAAHERGAKVVITNSSAPKLMQLYLSRGFTITGLKARRSVSCDITTRGNATDIIATL